MTTATENLARALGGNRGPGPDLKKFGYGTVVMQAAIIPDAPGLAGGEATFAAFLLGSGSGLTDGQTFTLQADTTDGYFAAIVPSASFSTFAVFTYHSAAGGSATFAGMGFAYYFSLLNCDGKKRSFTFDNNSSSSAIVTWTDSNVYVSIYSEAATIDLSIINDPANAIGAIGGIIGGNFDGNEIVAAIPVTAWAAMENKSEADTQFIALADDIIPANSIVGGVFKVIPGVGQTSQGSLSICLTSSGQGQFNWNWQSIIAVTE